MACRLGFISRNALMISPVPRNPNPKQRFHQIEQSAFFPWLSRHFADGTKQDDKASPFSKHLLEVLGQESLKQKSPNPSPTLERSVRRNPDPLGSGQDELSRLERKTAVNAPHPKTDEESPPLQGGVLQEIHPSTELQQRTIQDYKEQEQDPDYQECVRETLLTSLESLRRSAEKEGYKIQSGIPLQPGLVHIKQGIHPREQKELAEEALRLGNDPENGFWKLDKEGKKVLNSKLFRGRIFGALDSFPSIFKRICMRNLILAAHADNTIRYQTPTHLILLYYQTLEQPPKEGYIPWHQDNGENDGDDNYPVISFTLGDSVDFLVTNSKPKISKDWSIPDNLAQQIHFESGDALIFGGPSRLIWHSVYKIYKDTAPAFLPLQGARLNFTFRYAPKLIGDEERFATKNMGNLGKDNPFFKLSKMK